MSCRFRDGFVSLNLKDMRNVNLQWGTTCSDHSLLDCMNVLGGRQWGHAIAGTAALVRGLIRLPVTPIPWPDPPSPGLQAVGRAEARRPDVCVCLLVCQRRVDL